MAETKLQQIPLPTDLPVYSEVVTPSSSTYCGEMSIEDYERMHHMMMDHVIASAATVTTTTTTTTTTTNRPTLKKKVTGETPAEPRPLRKANTSDAVKELHETCQLRGIPLPAYKYEEYESQKFRVKMSVDGRVYEQVGPFQNKREAKQAVSEAAYEDMKSLPIPPKKPKDKKPEEENFVGIIHEFMVAIVQTGPNFQDFTHQNAYTCELTLTPHTDKVFGSRTLTFQSKKLARANAAREAVEWLRDTGTLRTAKDPISKNAKADSCGTSAEPSSNQKCVLQVNALCRELNLGLPRYHYDKSSVKDIFSVTAYFDNVPDIRGPVGEVKDVFGKKFAKDECARRVVEFLLAYKARKLEADESN